MAREMRSEMRSGQGMVDLHEMGFPFVFMGLMGVMGIATVVGMGMANFSFFMEEQEFAPVNTVYSVGTVHSEVGSSFFGVEEMAVVEAVVEVAEVSEMTGVSSGVSYSVSSEMAEIFAGMEGGNVSVILGEEVTFEPSDFVMNLPSAELMNCQYLDEPSVNAVGVREVSVLVSGGGRTQRVVGTLSVGREDSAPVIEGVAPMSVLLGSTVSYRSGVVATNRFGEVLELEVDASAVNLNKVGTYVVVYRAVDESGVVVEETNEIEVINNTENMVKLMNEEILEKIVKEDMSEYDKAYAIYKWVSNNISYTSGGERDDLMLIAYNGLRTGTGDCYAYQAVAYYLLRQAGISAEPLQRISSASVNHRWLAVNVGYGWYHFDACPNSSKQDVFMYSDSAVKALTAVIDRIKGVSYHYFDYATPSSGITMVEK